MGVIAVNAFEQKVFVIALQANSLETRHTPHDAVDHFTAAGASVDIVADIDQHASLARVILLMLGLDSVQQSCEKIISPMHVTNGVVRQHRTHSGW